MRPIDFGRLQEALASTRGWLELAVALLCIGLAWATTGRLTTIRGRSVRTTTRSHARVNRSCRAAPTI